MADLAPAQDPVDRQQAAPRGGMLARPEGGAGIDLERDAPRRHLAVIVRAMHEEAPGRDRREVAQAGQHPIGVGHLLDGHHRGRSSHRGRRHRQGRIQAGAVGGHAGEALQAPIGILVGLVGVRIVEEPGADLDHAVQRGFASLQGRQLDDELHPPDIGMILAHRHASCTKLSMTFLSPALSKATSSLLPSTAMTRP